MSVFTDPLVPAQLNIDTRFPNMGISGMNVE